MTAMTTPTPEHEELTEAEFDERYGPITGPDGSDIWEYNHVKGRPTNHVWSVVEGDDGNLYTMPGWHVVNMVGYSVTERPWEHENITVTFDVIPLD